ncbi:MAG TPA: hypothetical protein VN644_07905 [Pyrinomonadaceae bacterium]|jgi:hypothetical protein|nr:hypothetical protein [Pyrinomonadaceae bacterium]
MRWKSRLTAFTICFVIGLAAALIIGVIVRRQRHRQRQTQITRCAIDDYFNRPEEVLAAIKSDEVDVRRAMFKRLLLRPEITTIYYDYERDLNYPERVDRARLEYVQLDDTSETEALLTFVRLEHPTALVFSRESCGWKLVGALSSWLRFEDYPYDNWLTLPTTIKPGIHELLVRDSNGDATSYVRKARLLRLDHGRLAQIAEFDEEILEPVKEYVGYGWNDVKRKQSRNVTFSPGDNPVIQIETTTSFIKLRGSIPSYSYWSETDGVWHAAKRNWNARSARVIEVLSVSTQPLAWIASEGRFVGK